MSGVVCGSSTEGVVGSLWFREFLVMQLVVHRRTRCSPAHIGNSNLAFSSRTYGHHLQSNSDSPFLKNVSEVFLRLSDCDSTIPKQLRSEVASLGVCGRCFRPDQGFWAMLRVGKTESQPGHARSTISVVLWR
jgi:hypothetical protein